MIHGTKKQKIIKTAQQLKEQEQLSSKINEKLSDFFIIRKKPFSQDQIPKYMEFTTLLMQLCSDIPTIFNFRRQLLQRFLSINDIKKQAQTLIQQIKLVTKLIQDDPKSYTLWSFRQWLVQKIYLINPQIVTEEKKLCKMLLMKDQKNFHVWNYRNWVNSVQFHIDEQLLFTQQKIKSNPFNFSPYHFRSKYLPIKSKQLLQSVYTSIETKKQILKFGMSKQTFDSELQSIKTALFLNPNEQAPWIYYRWLLKRIVPVIVLNIKKDGDRMVVHLNERVRRLQAYIQNTQIAKKLTIQSLTNEWTFQTSENLGFKNFSLNSSSLITTQSIEKLFISQQNKDNTLILSEIRQIFKTEESFIRQILQQQRTCRFALLQVLELMKNQLSLTCSKDQFQLIVNSSHQIFQKLETQTKNTHYIEKLKQYWLRISKDQQLLPQEKLLIKSNDQTK